METPNLCCSKKVFVPGKKIFVGNYIMKSDSTADTTPHVQKESGAQTFSLYFINEHTSVTV
jgi:hypothetical protein